MALDETVSAPPSGGLEDDDDVDLSFAGPEPVPTASLPARLLDLVSAYLPLLLMAVLASGTWWLVRNAPSVEAPRAEAVPRHEPDYEMANFIVQRFAKDGTLRTEIEGDRLRHFPDTDTLEVDQARIRAIDREGIVTVAVANKALANGDGSEVQLLGDARVTRPAHDGEEQIEFRSEFLHAFRNVERVRSHLPVVVTQGASVVRADGMEYDNLARVIDLMGHTRATFVSPRRPATP
jgi:lipopolysaccharide export system protein LptC